MQAPDLSRLQGSLVLPTLRGMCISLAAEAVAHQQPPMQYVLRGAAEPAIAQLMKLAIGLQECRMLETSTCMGSRCRKTLQHVSHAAVPL